MTGNESFSLTDVVSFGGGHHHGDHGQNSSEISADKDDLQFGWQRSLPTSHHRFRSSHGARVQDITSKQERVNAEIWGEKRSQQRPLRGAKHKKCREGSDSGDGNETGGENGEQMAWWTPEQPRETQAALSSGPAGIQTEQQIERDITMKKRWGAVSKQARKIGDAKARDTNLQVAHNKAKGFILYAKSEQRIEMMNNALNRYEDLTKSARYQNIQRVLQDPDQAIAPLLNLCDVDCTENFASMQDQLQPMAFDAKRHITHTAKDLRKDEDENSIQDIYLKQSLQTHQEMQASSKKQLSLGAGTLESAVKSCFEEFTHTTQSINSLKREHKQRSQAYQGHCDEMVELERREAHITSIIDEVEGRAREAEFLQKEKVKKLQQDVFNVKRQLEGMERACKIELHKAKAVWDKIEEKLLFAMMRNVQNMLQLRTKRNQQELHFQELSMNCRKAQLKRFCRKLKKQISQAQVRLHDALEVNQVFELRHCQIEGEALHMELELRSRELIEANGIPGLHINPNAEDGLFPLLQRELHIQLQWFAERSHHFILDRNTLNLTKQATLTTPLMLLNCTRELLQSWEQGRQAKNGAEVTGFSSYNASSPCVMDEANGAKMQGRSWRGAGKLVGRFANLARQTSSSSVRSAGIERDSPADGLQGVDGAESGISYQPILSLDTSAAPEDHEKQQEAFDATRKAFKTNAADMFMESILKRPNGNDSFRHHFLQELRLLPATGLVVDQIAEGWSDMQTTLAGLPSIATLQPSMDGCMADLQSARQVADTCSFWITEGANTAGIFSDVLVMDLIWLCRFCERISERAGVLRGIVAVLEEASGKAAKQDRVAGAATKLLLMSKPLLNQAMLKSAEAWMRRIVRVLHDQHCAKMACHSALRWYCGKFYGQGQADLDAIVRGVEVMERIYNAPQLQQSPAAKRLFAGEVDAEVRAALVTVLKHTESQSYESALLVFDVIVSCSAEDAVGAAFAPVNDDASAVSDFDFAPRFSTVSVISENVGMTDAPAASPTWSDDVGGTAVADAVEEEGPRMSRRSIGNRYTEEEGPRMSRRRTGNRYTEEEGPRMSRQSIASRYTSFGSAWAGEDEGLLEDDLYDEQRLSIAHGSPGLQADAADLDSEPDSRPGTPGELAIEEKRNHRRCALRAQLSEIDTDTLRSRAIALGVSDADLKGIDNDDSKTAASALIALIVAAAIPLVINTAEHRRNALEAELAEVDADTLREKAIALGATGAELKRIENDSAKAAASELIALIIAASIPGNSKSAKKRRSALQEELAEVDKDTLRKQAVEVGVDGVELQRIDEDNNKAAASALVALIVSASVPLHSNSAKRRRCALQAELTEMDKDTLHQRAIALGVSGVELNQMTRENKDAASTLIQLIVARSMLSPLAPPRLSPELTEEDCPSSVPALGSRLHSPAANAVIMSIIERRANSASPPEGEPSSAEENSHLQDALRGDLSSMDPDELCGEAVALGVSESELRRIMERIDDGDDAAASLVDLIVAAAYPLYPMPSPAKASKQDGGKIAHVADVGMVLLRQLDEGAAKYAEGRSTRKLARAVIDDALSHVAYAPRVLASDSDSEEIIPREAARGRRSRVSFAQAGMSQEGHLDAKARLEREATSAYTRLSAHWKLVERTTKALTKFHQRNAWAGSKSSSSRSIGSAGGRSSVQQKRRSLLQSGAENAIDDTSDDMEDVGEVVGQKKDCFERRNIRKLLSLGSQSLCVEQDSHQDRSPDIGEQIAVTSEDKSNNFKPETEHSMVDSVVFLKQLKCLKQWFQLWSSDPKDKGKWMGCALKQKLEEARETLRNVARLGKPGIKEEDPLLVYGMKLIEEQNQEKFLGYWKILESMIHQRVDPMVTKSAVASYNNEMLHMMMSDVDDVDSEKDKDLGTTRATCDPCSPSSDMGSWGNPRTPNLPRLSNSLQDQNSLQDRLKYKSAADDTQVTFGNLTLPLFESAHASPGQHVLMTKRKAENRTASEKDVSVKPTLMSEKEVSVQEAIAPVWRATIAEKPASSVEDWVERCAQSAQRSTPWLQRMRAEHAASTPGVSTEEPLVKADDIARLPGLQTCLFETTSSDRQHKATGTSATGKAVKTPRIANVDRVVPSLIPVSAMLPISPLEVSTVLTSGQLCGAPSSKIGSLGRDAVASGDAMMLGSVLTAKPSLKRRLNEPLVSLKGSEALQRRAKYLPPNKPHSARQPPRRWQLYEALGPL